MVLAAAFIAAAVMGMASAAAFAATGDNTESKTKAEATAEMKAATVTAEPEETASGDEITAGSCRVDRLKVPADASVLTVVEGIGLNANVYVFTRTVDNSAGAATDTAAGETAAAVSAARTSDAVNTSANAVSGTSAEASAAHASSWKLTLSTPDGRLGRKGMGKEKEGDEKTPVGIFRMNTPFGIKAAEEGFPANYLKVDSSYYWNGDSASDRYNKLVNTGSYTAFDKKESEHLADYAGYYDYALDMGYNADGTAHKGSALFLHCSVEGQNTGGCVAVPAEFMKGVLRLYKEGSSYIVLAPAGQFEQFYQ